MTRARIGPVTRVGAQYDYIRREAFEGIGGAPGTDNNIVLTSLRYFPWEP